MFKLFSKKKSKEPISFVDINSGQIWKLISQTDNPFDDDVVKVRILDYKNNWVLYSYLPYESGRHSMDEKTFRSLYYKK